MNNNLSFPDAPMVLKNFLQYQLVIQGKSQNTVHEYYYDLRTFFRYLKNTLYNLSDVNFEDIDIKDITIDDIKKVNLSTLYDYLSFINLNRENESRTRARKVSSLKAFFKYLVDKEEVLTVNPTEKLETPKLGKTLPTHLSLDEAKKLLDTVSGPNKERDFCILTLFLNCGLRLSELIGINLKDIKEDTIRIRGKGNKERTIYLNGSCVSALSNYMRLRPVDGVKDADALFISKQKRRISEQMVQVIVKKYIKAAGLDPNKYSPHKLRHTAATLLYKYGDVDIRILQEMLGHKNLNTTQIYTHIDNKQVKEAAQRHPLA